MSISALSGAYAGWSRLDALQQTNRSTASGKAAEADPFGLAGGGTAAASLGGGALPKLAQDLLSILMQAQAGTEGATGGAPPPAGPPFGPPPDAASTGGADPRSQIVALLQSLTSGSKATSPTAADAAAGADGATGVHHHRHHRPEATNGTDTSGNAAGQDPMRQAMSAMTSALNADAARGGSTTAASQTTLTV